MKRQFRCLIPLLPLLAVILLGGCGKTVHRTHVTSRPSGALLFLNDRIVGETPCDVVVQQRKGDYNIYAFKAVKEDYKPARKAFKEQLYYQTVDDVVPEAVHFDLEKRKIYKIHMTSVPSGAVVLLNGEVIGETPFTAIIKERIGSCRTFEFVATKDGYLQVKKELKEFAPQKNGAVFEFPETMHFDLVKQR
ncbi:peptidase associated/transthyretin-like domain-containing protein [Desulfomarina profundi]|uniref:PEGA domain-containing protein n=1 Tax=Desulfomarina profundi TaxID=2772557 RepID=UPI001E5BF996|nr:PEGA domain-containing protein [Desulfomarina profundi]